MRKMTFLYNYIYMNNIFLKNNYTAVLGSESEPGLDLDRTQGPGPILVQGPQKVAGLDLDRTMDSLTRTLTHKVPRPSTCVWVPATFVMGMGAGSKLLVESLTLIMTMLLLC